MDQKLAMSLAQLDPPPSPTTENDMDKMKLSNSIKDIIGHVNASKNINNKTKILKLINILNSSKKKGFFYFKISKNSKPRGPNGHRIK